LYASLNSIGITESGRIRWVEHVARIGEMWDEYKILVDKPNERPKLCIHVSYPSILSTCPAHRSLLDFVILTVVCSLFKSRSFHLYNIVSFLIN
jgi:hypothetical protein